MRSNSQKFFSKGAHILLEIRQIQESRGYNPHPQDVRLVKRQIIKQLDKMYKLIEKERKTWESA